MKQNYKPSNELKKFRLGTAKEERKLAGTWMDTAAQHCRNEEYWRLRALKAEKELLHYQYEEAREKLEEEKKHNIYAKEQLNKTE